jgi:hypothetical protein
MYARPLFVVVGISGAFSGKVAAGGSRQENASNQKAGLFWPFSPDQLPARSPRLGIIGGCGYTLAP